MRPARASRSPRTVPYSVCRSTGARSKLPQTRPWCKRGAGFSSITGVLLLILVYSLDAATMVADRAITGRAAWLIHEGLGRRLGLRPLRLAAMLALAALVLVFSPRLGARDGPEADTDAQPVAFERVAAIIHERCANCHAADPSYAGYARPPAGVVLETPAQIRDQRQAIDRVAVQSRYMPLANITGMTDAERQTLATWVAAGGD